MRDWVKWGEIETVELNFCDVFYILLVLSVFMFFALSILSTDPNSFFGNLSIGIGLFGLLMAFYSIQSSSKKLKEMQVDYWNARGIDDNNNGTDLYKQHKYLESAIAYESALEAFDKASKLDPLYAKSWSNRGNALVAQGKYAEALAAFDRAIELDSQSSKTLSNKGEALFEEGKAFKGQGDSSKALQKYNEAIKFIDEAIKQDSDLSFTWSNKGAVLQDQGDIFRDTGDPLYDDQYTLYTESYYANYKYDEAIECYENAIRLNSKIAVFWYNKAIALRTKGKYDEAAEAYDKAIELDPKNTMIWSGKGEVFEKQKKYNAGSRSPCRREC